MNAFAPEHEILVLIAYAQNPHLHVNAHAVVHAYGWARGLKVGLSLNLHPYFVYASSEGSGASVKL